MVYNHGSASSSDCNPNSAIKAKIKQPTPMPNATAMPSRREEATAVRATRIKLCPGLIAPSVIAPVMLNTDNAVSLIMLAVSP
ncbi:hypothetical protein D3C80_1990700 [compost metagenome]